MFNINYIILVNKLELTREKQILLILEIRVEMMTNRIWLIVV